jgi:hypothetical protein
MSYYDIDAILTDAEVHPLSRLEKIFDPILTIL